MKFGPNTQVRVLVIAVLGAFAAAACSGDDKASAADAGSAGVSLPSAGSGGKSAAGGVSGGGVSAAGAAIGGGGGRELPAAAGADALAPMPNDAGAVEPEDAAVQDAGALPAECGHCKAYAAPMQTGMVEPAELSAVSGLATSRSQPEIVFVHNDHDRPVVYALDLAGRLHARITLEGAAATDIEDIAIGPCGAQTCVYLGDIGDNAAARNEYAVLRFTQPTVPTAPGTNALTASYERFRFTYEDGSHNAESLLVAPDGALYIITKLAPSSGGRVAATGVSSVYRLPAAMSTTAVARATKVATLTVPASGDLAASAAAAHPCGLGFVLRTYNRVYEFLTPQGANFEAAFAATPTVVA
ncbi:MAG: hypothetical protein RL701_7758, partial [Pseudomonadota bacterium]